MNKEFILNKVPWLWLTIFILTLFILAQNYHILILKKSVYLLNGVVGTMEKKEKKRTAPQTEVYSRLPYDRKDIVLPDTDIQVSLPVFLEPSSSSTMRFAGEFKMSELATKGIFLPPKELEGLVSMQYALVDVSDLYSYSGGWVKYDPSTDDWMDIGIPNVSPDYIKGNEKMMGRGKRLEIFTTNDGHRGIVGGYGDAGYVGLHRIIVFPEEHKALILTYFADFSVFQPPSIISDPQEEKQIVVEMERVQSELEMIAQSASRKN